MDFITIEGVDGTGKSTVHEGFMIEGEDGLEKWPGVVERLDEELDRPVFESREPGSYHRDGPRFQSWDPINLERHFNIAMVLLGVARSITEDQYVKRVIDAAAFVKKYQVLPDEVFNAVIDGEEWPEAFYDELASIHDKWQEFTELLTHTPALSRKFNKYNARDAIRHALVYSEDSDKLPPSAAGLMFFANHVLHGKWLSTLPNEALVISDRAAESNFAYGRARGDDVRIEKLYRKRRPFEPDAVLLLTCDREEIADRIGLRDKKENKSWSEMETLRKAENAYEQLENEMSYPFFRVDTTGNHPRDSVSRVKSVITDFLDQQKPAAQVQTASV